MWVLPILFLGMVSLAIYDEITKVHTRPHKREIKVAKCGYESCIQHNPYGLNIHIVPHTHNDVGWVRTLDEYYDGNLKKQHRGYKDYWSQEDSNRRVKVGYPTVRNILDSVVTELWKDPKRRFIYAESYFFFRWWQDQNSSVKDKVRQLVKQGRLQFAGGAWSMNDEATTHYQAIIDQFTIGLRYLNETFGTCGMPTVGWQIDPFGHSKEFAALLAGMGYDGVFFGRIDYQDKLVRKKKKTMEMVWRGDDSLGAESDIFAGVLYNQYEPPPGLCFDSYCRLSKPIIDHKKALKLLNFAMNMSESYRTGNVMITMGGDFHYDDAKVWFDVLDQLIRLINLEAGYSGFNVKTFYSTPQCYLKAVKDADPVLPTKEDDFFPYAENPDAYWTGFYTSRPTLKYLEREANRYLQMAKQLLVLSSVDGDSIIAVNKLKSAMGILQHHDAVTGTAKQYVARDYTRILNDAIEGVLAIPRRLFNQFMLQDASVPPTLSLKRCRLNESSCAASEGKQFIVTLYNILAWKVKEPVRIPVLDGTYQVYAPDGDIIASQLVDIPPQILHLPSRRSKATHEIIFIAFLEPLSYKSFYIKDITDENDDIDLDNDLTNETKQRVIKRSVETDINNTELFKIIKTLSNDSIYVSRVNKRNYDISEYYENDTPLARIDNEITNITNHSEISHDNPFWHDKSTVSTTKFDKNIVDIITKKLLLNDPNRANSKQTNRAINNTIVATDKNNMTTNVPTANEFKSKKDAKSMDTNLKNNNAANGTRVSNKTDKSLNRQKLPNMHMENKRMKILVNLYNQIIDTTLSDGTEAMFKINFYYYDTVDSGAYIFRPEKTTATKFKQEITKQVSGDIVKEIRTVTEGNTSNAFRIYDGLDYIENDWVVGPIDNSRFGKEIVLRYDTDISSNGYFYTDSNGRQMIKRKLDYRPQWHVHLKEPVSGNYYPIVNKITIQDDKVKLSVITDRAEGGTCLKRGQLEILVHRRLVKDDIKGLDEVLNETDVNNQGLVVRGKHRIFLSRVGSKEDIVEEKKNVLQVDLQPLVFVSEAANLNLEKWLQLNNQFAWADALPIGVHLLTLEYWDKDQILVRLENYLHRSEMQNSFIGVDLKYIFKTLNLKWLKEMTLAANRHLKDVKRWSWKTPIKSRENDTDGLQKDNRFKIKLKAKQIRTFVITYSRSFSFFENMYYGTFDFLSGLSGADSLLMSTEKISFVGCVFSLIFALRLIN